MNFKKMDLRLQRALVLTRWPWLRTREEQEVLDKYLDDAVPALVDRIMRAGLP